MRNLTINVVDESKLTNDKELVIGDVINDSLCSIEISDLSDMGMEYIILNKKDLISLNNHINYLLSKIK